VALFFLLFASYAYFYQAGGWNQNSRFDLVRAIANDHTFRIDPYRHATGDEAFFDGHYYSDKAPGLALAAAPAVALAHLFIRPFGGDPETYAGIAGLSYLATVVTASLFTALAGVSLFTLCVELGATNGGALFAALTFGLATPMWTLATIFIAHAFSAALLVLALRAAMRIGTQESSPPGTWRDAWTGAIVGASAGWATVSEFPAAVPAVVLALFTARQAWPLGHARAGRILGAMTVAALACAAVLMAYQYACFGSPFHVAYSSESEPGYGGMEQGLFGVGLPSLIRLRLILFDSYRGLLPLAPTVALAPAGLALMMFQNARAQRAAIVASLIGTYYLLLNASYVYWDGGWSYGPRHASPAIPFLCLGLSALWTAGRRVGRVTLAVVSAYGAAVTLVAVSTMPLPPNGIMNPVADFLLPAFRDGDLALNTQTFVSRSVDADFRLHRDPKAAFNLGMKAGLEGHRSLIPLAIVWLGCALAFIVPGVPRGAAAGRGQEPARASASPWSSSPSSRASP
jgi:hypothetical protein